MKTNTFFTILIFSLSILILISCGGREDRPDERDPMITKLVTAKVETEPVISLRNEDAADDPAIWVNSSEPEKSFIVGTNKKMGLCTYNLKGEEVAFHTTGLINNVDLREGVDFNGEKIVLVAGSNRTNNSIALLKLDTITGELTSINETGILTNLVEVYGFCLYHDIDLDKFYAYVNGKSGTIQQWELFEKDGQMDGKLVRELNVDSQPEGMVADEETHILYVGEEIRGIWKFQAKADAPVEKHFIANSDETNSMIKYDTEGLAIYYQPNGKGYLIASSQGNYSYAVFNREGNNDYLFSFFIDDSKIDGVEETDGLEATNRYLGPEFPNGALIVQDGYNFENDTLANQNFKIVDWNDIAKLADVKLLNDSSRVF